MSIDKVHIRHCLLYEFRQGRNSSQAVKNICNVYGSQALEIRTAQRWFNRFRSGKFSLENERGAGRPLKIDNDLLRTMVDADPHQTTRDLAEKLGVNHSTVVRQLQRIGISCLQQSEEIKESENTQILCDIEHIEQSEYPLKD